MIFSIDNDIIWVDPLKVAKICYKLKRARTAEAMRLKEEGLSNAAIAERIGIKESSVRVLIDDEESPIKDFEDAFQHSMEVYNQKLAMNRNKVKAEGAYKMLKALGFVFNDKSDDLNDWVWKQLPATSPVDPDICKARKCDIFEDYQKKSSELYQAETALEMIGYVRTDLGWEMSEKRADDIISKQKATAILQNMGFTYNDGQWILKY